MKLLTLAQKLDFTTETEYFDYCVDSYLNGNLSQCRNLFKAMTRKDRKNLIDYIEENFSIDNNAYSFYWNLL